MSATMKRMTTVLKTAEMMMTDVTKMEVVTIKVAIAAVLIALIKL